MEKPNIALIGLRATGKSLVGGILARKMSRPFVDMDERLTDLFGIDINTWVRAHDWEAFRKAEAQLLATLAAQHGLVVATGGGAVLKPANREILRDRFFVVWLKASAETLHARLLQDRKTETTRPPLTDLDPREEIDHLARERAPLYEDCADLVLDTDSSQPEDLAAGILSVLAERSRPVGI